MKIETLALSQIKPYKNNPRDNEAAVEAVMNSIRSFGFLVPMVIDAKGVIVTGHTRYLAAKRLKLKEVPTIRATHLKPAQIAAFRVIDNRTSELADWNEEKLFSEVEKIMGAGEVNLGDFGFGEDELAGMLNAAGGGDDLPDLREDEVVAAAPEKGKTVSKKAKSVRIAIGDVRFHVPIKDYETWLHNVSKANGFDDDRIIAALAKKLGFTPGADAKAKTAPPVKRTSAARRKK